MQAAATAIAVGCACWSVATAQTIDRPPPAGVIACKSAGASLVAGQVRSAAPGTVMEVFVKVGDTVKKGQVLGHTELDATKLQLDLAEHALLDKSNVDSTEGQAEAWKVTREETEDAVRRHKAEKSRLKWALGMEKMFRGTYEAQVSAEGVQQIQYDYWKAQYEKRFFRAPVDGVVSAVLAEVGKAVSYATPVFTIDNDDTYAVPVSVPAPLVNAAVSHGWLTVRSADGKTVSRAMVDSVTDDPAGADRKIIKLLIHAVDLPVLARENLTGMKFDVLLPQVAQAASR